MSTPRVADRPSPAPYVVVFAILVAAIILFCSFGWRLRGEGLLDFSTEVSPPDDPQTVRIVGRVRDGISVIKSVRSKVDRGGVMHVTVRATFAGMPFASGSGSFDITRSVPPGVTEIRFSDRREAIWRRTKT